MSDAPPVADAEQGASFWRAALSSKDPDERAEAVVRLARSGAEVEAELREALGDACLLVRVSAVYALWEATGELVHPEYVVAGLHADDENTLAVAVQTLSGIGAPLMPALRSAFEAGGDVDPVYPRALAEIEDEVAQRELRRLARDASGPVAAAAREALGEAQGER
jgi:HEAT repeat protein